MANLIGDHMQAHGINFIRNSIPKRVEKLDHGRLEVTFDSYEWGEEHSDVFDTVVMAVGKMPLFTIAASSFRSKLLERRHSTLELYSKLQLKFIEANFIESERQQL